MNKDAKIVLSFLVWFVGVAAVNALLLTFIPRPALDYIIAIFAIAWGIACIWLYNNL